jgi:hypothetical protein
MKIRIISDIHIDINKKMNYQFDFGDDFVVCCGDISGDRFTTEKWVKENIKNGVFVEGNHLGYEHVTRDINDTRCESIKYLKRKFNGKVRFLENNIYIVEDVVFVGCTLFTDFNLNNDIEYCKLLAQRCMNDYKYVFVKYKDYIKRITPENTIKYHNASVKFINETCKKYKDNKIVVVTHHAPSIHSINENFKNDMLNAAYASNLEWIMKENDNLVLWCHGHTHHNVDYIKHGTRVVCNTLGYFNKTVDIKNYGTIIDTDNIGYEE